MDKTDDNHHFIRIMELPQPNIQAKIGGEGGLCINFVGKYPNRIQRYLCKKLLGIKYSRL